MTDIPEIRIHQQNRRSLVMKLTPVGVVVFIPKRMKPTSPTVQKFIAEGLAKLGQRRGVVTPAVRSADDLRAMVRAWAQTMGLNPGRVQVRDMYRKWGSCSSKGNISFNTALLRVPEALAEYVVVHELVHLRVFNHGKDFKAMMSAYLPDWQTRSAALDALLGGPVD